MRDQRAVDRDHLNVLAIFHFVVAALAIVGIAFLFLHYTLMSSVFEHPGFWQPQHTAGATPLPHPSEVHPPQFPAHFFAIFKWFYVVAGVCLLLAFVGNLFSGFFLRARKHRVFSLVVAGLDCLQIPFGTVLGVFTIVVLARESVMELYRSPPQ